MLDPGGVLVAVGGIGHIAVLILKVFADRLQNCTSVLPFSVVVRQPTLHLSDLFCVPLPQCADV